MDRGQRQRTYRRTLIAAIGISVGVHLVALAWLKLDVPVFEDREPGRALQIVDIPDEWEENALDVVVLESGGAFEATIAEPADASPTSARVDAPVDGAGGADAAPAAIVPLNALPGAAPGEPSMTLAFADATPTPAVEMALPRSNRGVIRRASTGGAAGESGFDFIATSDAARDAERERGGGGWGGIGGPGVSIIGGGDGHCPTWGGVPFVPPMGSIGGIPNAPKGRGVIGMRPPTSEAINRFGPRIGSGR
ncbi:MAG: hypothetical protein OEU54_10475 [Gemmatimonadota bacterium]|nr:hypothetical protein [Gemmatimonadota bacterium]